MADTIRTIPGQKRVSSGPKGGRGIAAIHLRRVAALAREELRRAKQAGARSGMIKDSERGRGN